ncbi:MAG TPA: transporter substrate-binding domain-containing protein [Pseudomonas sp.]|nr:transporter substrate-binding domain-containing protein [Pseudomonas sp.]
MRKVTLRSWICLVLWLSSPWSWAACAKPLTVGWEPWKPFMYRDAEGRLTGLDVELMQAVAQRMDCPLIFVELPFKRHMLELEKGRIDLATSVQFTEQRERYAFYSKPYRSSEMRLVMRAGEPGRYPLTKIEQLRAWPFRLGITRGYFYGPEVEALMANPGQLKFEDVISDQVNLAKLEAGRTSGFFVDPIVLAGLAPALGSVELHPLLIQTTRFHFIASRQSVSAEFMYSFDLALAELQANGALQAIIDRYQLQ